MDETDRPPEVSAQWSTAPLPAGSLPFDPESLPPLPPKWSAPLADAPPEGVWKRFDQVKIACTTTMCDADLHCFLLTKKLAKTLSPGSCRTCGKPLVSLQRTAERDLSDIDATFAALQRECIRHYFWHVPWGQKGLNYALRKGRISLESGIEHVVRSRIGDAEPYRDGQQTPIDRNKANAYDYALHAVAACCRRCANYWHGIPTGRPLDDDEVAYLAELVRRYLQARLPDLQDEPMKVPSIRRQAEVHQIAHNSEQSHPFASDAAQHSHAS
jgi:ribosomal protein L34E